MSDQPPPGGYPPPGDGSQRGQQGPPPPGYAQHLGQQAPPGYAQEPGHPPYEQQEYGYGHAAGGQLDGSRKRVLLLVGGALALAVIALVVLLRVVYGGSEAERVAEDWFAAVSDQDCATLRQLSTNALVEDLEPLCSVDDLLNDDVALEITSSRVIEESDKTATVELTLLLTAPGEPQGGGEQDSTVELVKQDGDWKVSSAS